MASITRTSGGKIARSRRSSVPGAGNPYYRPRVSTAGSNSSPSWLSKLLSSPSRTIASGAVKVLTSVFDLDCPSSPSCSDFASERRAHPNYEIEKSIRKYPKNARDSQLNDDMDNFVDNDTNWSDGADEMENVSGPIIDPQSLNQNKEKMHAIEQLLMQETFSREECERLTYVIQSRVVDYPFTEGIEEVEMLERYRVIMEARKWLEENCVPNRKSISEYGTCSLNTTMTALVQSEVGSPAALARSSVQACPIWPSPSIYDIHLRSSSPSGIHLFKEGTPLPLGNSIPSSKLQRDAPATGSWNIQEEIRKVRAKATEEMLRTRPLSEIDWSNLGLDLKNYLNSLVNSKQASHEETVSPIEQGGLQNDVFPSSIATPVREQRQVATHGVCKESGKIVDGTIKDAIDAPKRSFAPHSTSQHLNFINEGTIQGLDKSRSTTDTAIPANAQFSSLSVGHGSKQKPRPEEPAGSPYRETCKLLTEASIDLPVVKVTDKVRSAVGSRDSAVRQDKDLPQEPTRPDPNHNSAGKTLDVTEKQKGKQFGGYYKKAGSRVRK